MAHLYEPPPSAHDLMRSVAEWIAKVYRVRVEFTIDYGRGERDSVTIDRLEPTRRREMKTEDDTPPPAWESIPDNPANY